MIKKRVGRRDEMKEWSSRECDGCGYEVDDE